MSCNAAGIGTLTDYGHPMKPFFIKIQNIWAWGFRRFSADLSALILVLWVPFPCFPLINHYFYKKTKPFPNMYLGLGCEFWLKRIRPSCVRSPWAHSNTTVMLVERTWKYKGSLYFSVLFWMVPTITPEVHIYLLAVTRLGLWCIMYHSWHKLHFYKKQERCGTVPWSRVRVSLKKSLWWYL